ncbi:zinc finger A20 and AN1 domain-containing stress-associated protein 3 [Mercurialis annua]|uniref:zinc finger A20 and AN1 domain-containing stress-associated protein 3 n=1 Tax=Mercurialis annua TaxID=3986 RepID=UPI0021603D56|nr:zinc finger A20 and AN1 domain-containing stress-associated protein 3 [Mercurialis annua]
MAEEHRCQAQRLCVNNCGFFGSPATQNLCSKCHRDLELKEHQSSNAKLAFNQTLAATSSSAISIPASSPLLVDLPAVSNKPEEKKEAKVKVEEAVVRPNRCMTCRKRVGLTGFKCRCDMVFCGTHRYPEQHECAFDFKSMGKEQIAKANPLIKANKLDNKL